MKVKMLRLLSGCYAFKGAQNVIADRDKVEIYKHASGYLVKYHGKCFDIGAHRVDFAEVEDSGKVPVERK